MILLFIIELIENIISEVDVGGEVDLVNEVMIFEEVKQFNEVLKNEEDELVFIFEFMLVYNGIDDYLLVFVLELILVFVLVFVLV